MKTVTFDEKTHAVVPIELTDEMLSSITGYNEPSSYDANIARRDYSAALQAAPPYQSEDVLNMVWIPVSERLPDHRNSVLCYAVNINGKINIKNSWLNPIMNSFYVDYAGDEPCEKITHWMNLPSAPKGEE